MIHFHISCSNPASQFINIRLDLEIGFESSLFLQLPAWRAGRYQLANYAQNIRGFRVLDENGNPLTYRKVTKDQWEVKNSKKLSVYYEYWAGKLDAGGAWAEDEQVYINFVNCCFEILGYSDYEILVSTDLPEFPEQISTLPRIAQFIWKAASFQQLADSTLLASNELKHFTYIVSQIQFHIWIKGEIHFDKVQLLENFKSFTSRMILDFGEFPEEEYHFIFQLLPFPHYHGVEHRRGTVITFGPAESLLQPDQMEELLGISSHELYHAWNVCRIRPKELLPYDFSKETYTQNGLILEGVTTYMGDLYLLKSGVYDLQTYLKHFEKVIQREVNNLGWANYSILESSFDLWLDGYIAGVPDRKVSIYTRGAILMFCLDVMLLKQGSSLQTIMTKMWDDFGKPFMGYEMQDFKNLLARELGLAEVSKFFNSYVAGYEDLFPLIISLFEELGISFQKDFSENSILHQFGVRLDSNSLVTQIHPESNAYSLLMKNDQVVNWEIIPENQTLQIAINRNTQLKTFEITEKEGPFFPTIKLVISESTPLLEKWSK